MSCDFLTIAEYSGISLVRIDKNRLTDAADISAVGTEIMALLDRHPRISLIIDMASIEAMSSQMLAKLVAIHKAVLRDRGRMCLAGVEKGVMPLFKTTKLHKVFQFEADAQKILLLWQRKPL